METALAAALIATLAGGPAIVLLIGIAAEIAKYGNEIRLNLMRTLSMIHDNDNKLPQWVLSSTAISDAAVKLLDDPDVAIRKAAAALLAVIIEYRQVGINLEDIKAKVGGY